MAGVLEVTLYGTLLHVLVDGLNADSLTTALQSHAIKVASVRPIKPSLEDVFVSRIRAGAAIGRAS